MNSSARRSSPARSWPCPAAPAAAGQGLPPASSPTSWPACSSSRVVGGAGYLTVEAMRSDAGDATFQKSREAGRRVDEAGPPARRQPRGGHPAERGGRPPEPRPAHAGQGDPGAEMPGLPRLRRQDPARQGQPLQGLRPRPFRLAGVAGRVPRQPGRREVPRPASRPPRREDHVEAAHRHADVEEDLRLRGQATNATGSSPSSPASREIPADSPSRNGPPSPA